MTIDRDELFRSLSEGLTMLHGTTERFDAFDLDRATGGPFGRGIYLSNDRELAEQYSEGGDMVRAVVTLANPYVVDMDLTYAESMDAKSVFRRGAATARERLVEMGHDGVVLVEGRYVEVVAYHPELVTGIEFVPSVEPVPDGMRP